MQKKAIALAIAGLVSTGAFAQVSTAVDLGEGGTPVFSGPTGSLTVTLDPNGQLLITQPSTTIGPTPGPGIPAVTLASSFDPITQTTTIYTVTAAGETTTTVTPTPGSGAVFDANGSLTLNQSSAATTVVTVDNATRLVIDSAPFLPDGVTPNPAFGTVISTTTGVDGTYTPNLADPTAGTFVEGSGSTVTTTSTPTGGNLTVKGATSTNGITNTGGISTDSLTDGTVILTGGTLLNTAGHGLEITDNGTILSGGQSASPTSGVLTLNDGDAVGGTNLTIAGTTQVGPATTVLQVTSLADGSEVNTTVGASTTDSTTVIQGGGSSATFTNTGVAVSGNTGITGTLTVSGATQINNTLTVTGNSTLGTAGVSTNTIQGSINNITASGEGSQNNITAEANTITGTIASSISGGGSSATFNSVGVDVQGATVSLTGTTSVTATSGSFSSTVSAANGAGFSGAGYTVGIDATGVNTVAGIQDVDGRYVGIDSAGDYVGMGNDAGREIAIDGSNVQMVNGANNVVLNGTTGALTANASGATLSMNGSEVSLLNTVGEGVQHGLTIDATQTTLTGGTNSSSLTLADGQATLAVGTATTPETNAIIVTGTAAGEGTTTAVAIGGASNTSTTIQSTGSNTVQGATNSIIGSTSTTIGTGSSLGGVTGNRLIVDADSARLVSTSGSNSVAVNNTGTVVTGNATVTGDLTASTNAYLGGSGANASLQVTTSNVTVAGDTAVSMGGNRIQNVANGVAATDAVNLRQLHETRTEARRGIAGASAIAGIPALESGKQYNFGVGVGHYKGESALAFGGNARFDANTVGRLAVGFSGGDATISAGVGWSF